MTDSEAKDRSGPDDALQTLLSNRRRFLAFLKKRTGSVEDAEDILQTVLVRAVERGGDLAAAEDVVAWFYRLLRNALVDHWRRKAAGKRALQGRARESPVRADDPELERVVCRCVDELVLLVRPEYRTLIARVDGASESISEVAADLSLTAGNARVRLHRARQALRREVLRACGACAEHGCLDCSCRTSSS